jgi:hypothetical protein
MGRHRDHRPLPRGQLEQQHFSREHMQLAGKLEQVLESEGW